MLYVLTGDREEAYKWSASRSIIVVGTDDSPITAQIKHTRAVVMAVREAPKLSVAIHCYNLPSLYVINNEIQRWFATGGKKGLDPLLVEAWELRHNAGPVNILDPCTKLIDCSIYETHINDLGAEFDELLYKTPDLPPFNGSAVGPTGVVDESPVL